MRLIQKRILFLYIVNTHSDRLKYYTYTGMMFIWLTGNCNSVLVSQIKLLAELQSGTKVPAHSKVTATITRYNSHIT